MVSIIRTSLLVLLVVLQSIAPLVHAHTGGFRGVASDLSSGLHVPGLEIYLSADTSAQSACFAAAALSTEGFAVGIHSGIKHNHPDCHHGNAVYLATAFLLPQATASPESTYFIHAAADIPQGQMLKSAHSPRAPPTL